jgi:hypothetical protein
MIVFAILGLLIGLLFMFVRQKLSALESRVNLLTDTVQTMAGFSRVDEDDEDDEDDADEEESEDEDESESEEESDEIKDIEPEKGYFPVLEMKEFPTIEKDEMEIEDIKVVSDDEEEVTVKKIQLEGPDYESLTLKELKDKVSDLGGPKLRTKKELLDFLKNVM